MSKNFVKFDKTYTLQERKDEFSRLVRSGQIKLSVPVIIETADNETKQLDKRKYLVPRDVAFNVLVMIVRKNLSLKEHQAVFFTVNNPKQGTLTLPSNTILVGALYETHHNDDGFLYVNYAFENVFG
jgi:hypothetical protein